MSTDLNTWSDDRRAQLDAWMAPLFGDAWPASFTEACRYPLFGGGKRIRPLLALAAYEAVSDASLDAAFPCAAAVEIVHTYSLVHDDLPCMDDDDVRRGRPTVHKAFGEGLAVLVGDALLTEAFAVLARHAPEAIRAELVLELAQAAGHAGMVGGQVADIGLGASIDDPAILERLHRLKTGALIRCAVRMGARSGGADAPTLDALTRYGEHVGLAFQLADDLLDADEAEDDDGPPSFVRLLGEDTTRERAHQLAADARAIARELDSPILDQLARFTVERTV
jgi:geranylgeranyl pyrophosphate synthase